MIRPITWVDVWAVQAALYRGRSLLDAAAPMRLGSQEGTRTLPLRGPDADVWEDVDAPCHDLAALGQPEWKPVKSLLSRLRQSLVTDLGLPTLGRVYLESLLPSAATTWASEDGDYSRTRNRVHIGLVTNPSCSLICGTVNWSLYMGQAVLIDTSIRHCAINCSTKPRIHLVVDVRKPDYEP